MNVKFPMSSATSTEYYTFQYNQAMTLYAIVEAKYGLRLIRAVASTAAVFAAKLRPSHDDAFRAQFGELVFGHTHPRLSRHMLLHQKLARLPAGYLSQSRCQSKDTCGTHQINCLSNTGGCKGPRCASHACTHALSTAQSII